jgi:hypothetical protein
MHILWSELDQNRNLKVTEFQEVCRGCGPGQTVRKANLLAQVHFNQALPEANTIRELSEL